MSILVDDEKIYSLYKEGRISDLAKVGSIAAASVLGGAPSSTMANATYNTAFASQNLNVLDTETFIQLWGKYYLTKEDRAADIARARRVLRSEPTVPQGAMNSINLAVSIFGGDEGVSPNVLEDLLKYTGHVETGYRTRYQYDGGPARGFWQVEPKTAISLLQHSTAYFGPKFRRQFGEDILRINRDTPRNRELIARLIVEDDNLAAAFAAAKWISVAKVSNLNQLK